MYHVSPSRDVIGDGGGVEAQMINLDITLAISRIIRMAGSEKRKFTTKLTRIRTQL